MALKKTQLNNRKTNLQKNPILYGDYQQINFDFESKINHPIEKNNIQHHVNNNKIIQDFIDVNKSLQCDTKLIPLQALEQIQKDNDLTLSKVVNNYGIRPNSSKIYQLQQINENVYDNEDNFDKRPKSQLQKKKKQWDVIGITESMNTLNSDITNEIDKLLYPSNKVINFLIILINNYH